MLMLSLILVHPAIPSVQRDKFLYWQEKVGGKTMPLPFLPAGPIGGGSTQHMSNGKMDYASPAPVRSNWRSGGEQFVGPMAPPPPPPSHFAAPPTLSLPGGDVRQPVRSSSMNPGDLHHGNEDGLDRSGLGGMLRSRSLPMPVGPAPKMSMSEKPFVEAKPGMKGE